MTLALLKPFAPWLGAGAALAVTLGAAGGWRAHRLASAGAVEAAQTEGFRRGQAFARCVAEIQTRSANLTAEEAEHAARTAMDAVRPDPAGVERRLREGAFLLGQPSDAPCADLL
ncbi:hypothetical protein [Neomegalonema sp.]|uniref:hypothetical protein n=1 Tax=Neomegalonema sp. TaxID=2039713 RepID=UPI00262B6BC6|nr:hypothetical protein [Neomegalonema sp.]MDD2869784.1 hypothetical protein [Neomegalonema sp.]